MGGACRERPVTLGGLAVVGTLPLNLVQRLNLLGVPDRACARNCGKDRGDTHRVDDEQDCREGGEDVTSHRVPFFRLGAGGFTPLPAPSATQLRSDCVRKVVVQHASRVAIDLGQQVATSGARDLDALLQDRDAECLGGVRR